MRRVPFDECVEARARRDPKAHRDEDTGARTRTRADTDDEANEQTGPDDEAHDEADDEAKHDTDDPNDEANPNAHAHTTGRDVATEPASPSLSQATNCMLGRNQFVAGRNEYVVSPIDFAKRVRSEEIPHVAREEAYLPS